jgi:hypothetical protein
MIDVQNILDCRAAVEAEIGPVEWREASGDYQIHVCWTHFGGPIDVKRSLAPAADTVKKTLERQGRKPLAASLSLEIVKAEHTALAHGETVAVLRVAYA